MPTLDPRLRLKIYLETKELYTHRTVAEVWADKYLAAYPGIKHYIQHCILHYLQCSTVLYTVCSTVCSTVYSTVCSTVCNTICSTVYSTVHSTVNSNMYEMFWFVSDRFYDKKVDLFTKQIGKSGNIEWDDGNPSSYPLLRGLRKYYAGPEW